MDGLDEDAHQRGDDAAHDHGPRHRGQPAVAGDDGLHAGQIGEADAEDHRQSRAEPSPDGKKLQQRGDGGHHQRRLDEEHPLALGQARGVGDDDGRCHAPHDHGHQMLQCHGDGHPHRRDTAELEQCLLAGLDLSHGKSSFCPPRFPRRRALRERLSNTVYHVRPANLKYFLPF